MIAGMIAAPDDLEIRHGGHDDLEHHVGAGAHDRGDQCSAGAGGGRDAAGHVGREPGAPHQRNGEGSGRGRIRDGASRQRPHQATADHGDLGRAAGRAREQALRVVDDAPRRTRGVERRPKQNERVDVGEHHLEGGAEDALSVEKRLRHDALCGVAAVRQQPARHAGSEVGVRQEDRRQDRQRQSDGAARRLQNNQQADGADPQVCGGFGARALAQGAPIEPEPLESRLRLSDDVGTASGCDDREPVVHEARPASLRPGLSRRDRLEAEHQTDQREDRQCGLRAEQRVVDLLQREHRQQDGEKPVELVSHYEGRVPELSGLRWPVPPRHPRCLARCRSPDRSGSPRGGTRSRCLSSRSSR